MITSKPEMQITDDIPNPTKQVLQPILTLFYRTSFFLQIVINYNHHQKYLIHTKNLINQSNILHFLFLTSVIHIPNALYATFKSKKEEKENKVGPKYIISTRNLRSSLGLEGLLSWTVSFVVQKRHNLVLL